jgi:hypothetical protein
MLWLAACQDTAGAINGLRADCTYNSDTGLTGGGTLSPVDEGNGIVSQQSYFQSDTADYSAGIDLVHCQSGDSLRLLQSGTSGVADQPEATGRQWRIPFGEIVAKLRSEIGFSDFDRLERMKAEAGFQVRRGFLGYYWVDDEQAECACNLFYADLPRSWEPVPETGPTPANE